MSKIYEVNHILLIITTIIFIFLYTYHSLYRINRALFLNKDAEHALDKTRNIPRIVFYVMCGVLILGLFVAYYLLRSNKEYLSIYFLALCPIIFILAIVGFFIYQSKIITFADSKDMKKGILACAIIIYFSLLNMYLYNNNKIELKNNVLMYLFGFFGTFTIIHFLYLVSSANTLTVQMANDKFDTLSKICLLGKKNNVENVPYKKPKKECDCDNSESFRCLVENYDTLIEKFENENNNSNSNISMESVKASIEKIPEEEYIKSLISEEEDNTEEEDLKYMNGIPIEYYNNKTQQFEDLCIRDFYYKGSYYSYLASSPEYGTPDLNALKGVVNDFKCRIIHLDIYSSIPDDEYSSMANPVVKCEKMNSDAKPLLLEDCLKIINKYAWVENEKSLPLFLYLKFNVKNKNIYQKTYLAINEYLGNYLVDKMYGFNERNHLFPISKLPIKEAFGKTIILTNVYPTYSILDEIINCNVEDKMSSIKMKEYKKDYIVYDEKGLLIDYTKNDIIKDNRININFFYSNPNSSYSQDAKTQSKAGLFNPNFYEIGKYGGQSALMYVYVPDKNMENMLKYFSQAPKDIILKRDFLRNIDVKDESNIVSTTSDLNSSLGSESAIKELVSYNLTFG